MSTIEMDELRECAAKQFAEIDRLKAELEKAQACAAEMREALTELKAELHEIKTKTYCAYCGVEFLLDSESCEKVGNHIATCEKHPMRYLEQQNQLMQEALETITAMQPCQHEGELFFPRHDPDGEWIGDEPVDPLGLLQDIFHRCENALAKLKGQ